MSIHDFQKIVPVEVDIDKIETVFNQVIVEYNPKENEKTASGIYTPAISAVDKVAEHAVRKGIVVKLPKYLYYNRKDIGKSMRWKTDIELEIGDEVWLNHLTMNDYQYRCNGKYYKTILYEDIVVAKRKGRNVVINGYLLIEPNYKKKKILQYEKEVIDLRYGTVSNLGKANKEYTVPEHAQLGKTVFRTDPDGVKAGDKVVFHKKAIKKLRFLEYAPYSKLDGKKYLVAQRHMIAGTVNGEKN